MKRLRLFIAGLVMALSFGGVLVPAVASAQNIRDSVCDGVALTGGSCTGGDTEITNVVRAVINILSWVVGVVAVVMIIVGGFKYVTSGGDSQSTASAKNTILFALVGLVVVVIAQAIVRFVISRAAPN